MPRRPNVQKVKTCEVALPEDLWRQLEAKLWSEVENRIPYGRLSQFFCARTRDFLSEERVDLNQLAPAMFPPGAYIICGSPESIKMLKVFLETK